MNKLPFAYKVLYCKNYSKLQAGLIYYNYDHKWKMGILLLVGKGSISHEEVKQKAIAEFEKYRQLEMLQYQSDYDRAIKELIEKEKSNNTNDKQ